MRARTVLVVSLVVILVFSLVVCGLLIKRLLSGRDGADAAPTEAGAPLVVRETVVVEKVVTATSTPTATATRVSSTTEPSATPTATSTAIVMARGEGIAWSFLPGGAWDSDTLKRWVKTNRGKVNQILALLGIENPGELRLVGVTTGRLPRRVRMLAVKPDGQIVQGDWLKKGTQVWYLELERPGGEKVRLAVNPACANLVGVLPPGVTATVVFTPVSTSTPVPPTSPPSGPGPKPTREKRPTGTPPVEVTEVPPTEVPPTEITPTEAPTEAPPTEIPPTEVPTKVPPTEVPTRVPPTEIPPTEVPPTEAPPTQAPPTEVPTEAPTYCPTPVPTNQPTPPGYTPVPTVIP